MTVGIYTSETTDPVQVEVRPGIGLVVLDPVPGTVLLTPVEASRLAALLTEAAMIAGDGSRID